MARYVILMGLGLMCSLAAQAADIRFGIDSNADLAALRAAPDPSNMPMPVQKTGNTFVLDGSAILHQCDTAHAGCSVEKMWAIAKDYNDYVKFGMPDLKQSTVVAQGAAGGDVIYAWIDMVAFFVESSSFLEVHTAPSDEGLSADSRGIYWVTVPPQPTWTEPSKPQFSDFHGSWYMQDLGAGDVYIRYYLSATSKSSFGGFLVGPRLQTDARKTVTIIWNQAISNTSAALQSSAQND